MKDTNRRIVVIGSGIAGISAAQGARRQDPDAEITVLSSESRLPYYRLRLCEILSGKTPEEKLAMHTPDWYAENNIRIRPGVSVTELRPATGEVACAGGDIYPYDTLVLATGSSSYLPPVEGATRTGVHTLWTMEDAFSIRQCLADVCDQGKRAVVVGGGLLGLEAAYHMAEAGCKPTVVEILPRLMPRQMDERGSALLTAYAEHLGIHVRTDSKVVSLEGDTDRSDESQVKTVRLSDGSRMDAEFVLFSAGVRAQTGLAEAAGIAVDRRIVADDRLRTSISSIFAAGDCVETNGFWSGQWMVARNQGLVAGANAAGADIGYVPAEPAYTLNTMGTSLVSAGLYDPPGPDAPNHDPEIVSTIEEDTERYVYRRFVEKDGRLLGFILLGNTSDAQQHMRRFQEPEPD